MASAARMARSKSFSCAIRVVRTEQSTRRRAVWVTQGPPFCEHRGRGYVEVGVEQNAPVFDVETNRKAGRSDKITEHHGDGAALGRNLRGSWAASVRARRESLAPIEVTSQPNPRLR